MTIVTTFATYFLIPLLVLVGVAYIARMAIGRSFAGPFGALFRAMPLTASFGLTVIAMYVIGAILAPVIAPYGESEVFELINGLPGQDPRFLLGTDQLGRDLFTRLIYGGRNTIGIALITTILAFFLGASLGFLAAVLGGWFDQVLSRIVDALMAIPQLIFALLLITILGQSTLNMILVIAVLDSTRVFRLTRAVGVNIVVMDYIEAAKLRGEGLGLSDFQEKSCPMRPHPCWPSSGSALLFRVPDLIASLSFLGVGIQPPLADWGTMVRDLAQFINFAVFAPQAVQLAAALLADAGGSDCASYRGGEFRCRLDASQIIRGLRNRAMSNQELLVTVRDLEDRGPFSDEQWNPIINGAESSNCKRARCWA